MKTWQKTITVMAVIALLVFGWSSPTIQPNANAQSIDAQSNEFEQLNQTAQKISIVEDPEKIKEIKDASLEAIASKEVVSNALNADLNYDKANVGEVFAENETYTVLTIPIASEDYNPLSNLTLISQNGEILTYSETLITKSKKNTVTISSYTDGVLTNEKITDIEYLSNSEVQEAIDKAQAVDLDENMVQPQGLAEVSLCLATVLLIDLTVARIVAATCIGACGTGVVPLCAACVGGVFVIGGANIGGVIACFQQA
ncbi:MULTISPECIES: hypothetical protein [Cytobacillus]|uniref:hypothetical protein n=1 Tax=Cytobacillus TaxID=2675230 RepID=UPI00203E41E7|nr:hypothetical protein [Cytobacillus firmus]MCM3708414.1 hypothetical protein [Cytobacillus firmus]